MRKYYNFLEEYKGETTNNGYVLVEKPLTILEDSVLIKIKMYNKRSLKQYGMKLLTRLLKNLSDNGINMIEVRYDSDADVLIKLLEKKEIIEIVSPDSLLSTNKISKEVYNSIKHNILIHKINKIKLNNDDNIKTKLCKLCNNEFIGKSYEKYCESCIDFARSEKLFKCPNCHKYFKTTNLHKKFCRKSCLLEYSRKKYKDKIKDGSIYESNSYLKLRWDVFKRDNFTCQYCGRNVKDDKIKLEADHIIPRSKKGKTIMNNLITSCFECNQGKKVDLLDLRTKNKIRNSRKPYRKKT